MSTPLKLLLYSVNAMEKLLNITIDLTEAGLELLPGEMEARSHTLADELRSGNLAESAKLARKEGVRPGAKSGMLAFAWGLLTAEISRENLKKIMDFLGNRFYGKTLTLDYKADGLECSLDYRNQEELEQAIAGVEQLEDLRIRVKAQQAG